MNRLSWNRRKVMLAIVLILVLGIGAVFAWVERTPLLVWYNVRGLTRAEERDRQAWLARVAGLDSLEVPRIVDCFRDPDIRVCANAQAGLAHLVSRWGDDDLRRLDVSGQLTEGYSSFSAPGQQAALDLQAILVHHAAKGAPVAAILPSATRMVAESSRSTESMVHARAIALAGHLLNQTHRPEVVDACRELTRVCLRDEDAQVRIQAIRLALWPGVEMVDPVAGLLHDPVAEVRRSAMLAVGRSQSAITTDDLLPWLHDPDPEVRKFCELALQSRGLQEEHLKLGRLMTDERAGTRLQVLDLLRHAHDLEPGIWLRRLSHDPAPAVRAAAMRAATEQRTAHLTDRLEQMAQNDPSATVRQLARYYLTSQKPVDSSNR